MPGTADVYFDVRSFAGYGRLTRQGLDDLAPADDTDAELAGRKRDPRDFALWKSAKDSEPATASWPTPWGRGRPGWHLECSAMATRYLGSGVRRPRRRASTCASRTTRTSSPSHARPATPSPGCGCTRPC